MPNREYIIKIDFELLSQFTSNDHEFTKKLMDAFLLELENFDALLKDWPTEEEFIRFRKAHHSIKPSLQMVGLDTINQIIEDYKAVYNIHPEKLNDIRSELKQAIQEVIDQAKHWQRS